jgi:cobalt/nickel transport protein
MRARVGLRPFLLGGLLVALLLAGVASAFASSSPDGLDSVTRKGCTFSADGTITSGTCIASTVRGHDTESSPFAGYATRGVGGPASTGLSGVAGVLVTLGIAWGLIVVLRRRQRVPVDRRAPDDGS